MTSFLTMIKTGDKGVITVLWQGVEKFEARILTGIVRMTTVSAHAPPTPVIPSPSPIVIGREFGIGF